MVPTDEHGRPLQGRQLRLAHEACKSEAADKIDVLRRKRVEEYDAWMSARKKWLRENPEPSHRGRVSGDEQTSIQSATWKAFCRETAKVPA